ncbi:adenosylhomocysteinase [Fervidicoccus fontis]|jgi:adenosylhomocysteinase|uniref:Adenosylhomocysteinase n=2 Tax=Fervidicoccus fontis TaxID=683846 RepID=I0A1B3_FERFK|nr:adenosylhomocysteinase [Fervidicoccus fontis]AFH42770.1 S-adenosyl-L-homocysteine hydrolase [Fervidicoccus fontis Kam940]MBE9391569.1 adenosylhomocysteinase [Fervidicoccus fontis]
MPEYWVSDINKAEEGVAQLEWAERNMPVLMSLRKKYSDEKPLRGAKIAACLHVTKETGVLVRTLKAWGAEVYLAASNPLSTQDDIAAALATEGVCVFAKKGESEKEYFWAIEKVASIHPDIVIDDGADLHSLLHEKHPEMLNKIKGGAEETTTGVVRLRALEKEKKLGYPVFAVNDAMTKQMFDNRYGTGQSTIDGLLRATNILISGKTIVVAGYGWVGRGIAARARGMGAEVIITEVDPVKALEAVMDGYRVMKMEEAAKIGDVFITATGDKDVITWKHMEKMKDGAILANSGHFNVEVSVKDLEENSISSRELRRYMKEYKMKNGKVLYLLAEGRLLNLVAAEGHPSEVMDMSFANQALIAKKVWTEPRLEPKVYKVPLDIDQNIAMLKLKSMGIEIDELTPEQKEYLDSWKLD